MNADHVELQIENLRGKWVGIAQGNLSWITEQAETFQHIGYCVRIKDQAGEFTEFLAEPHEGSS